MSEQQNLALVQEFYFGTRELAGLPTWGWLFLTFL
jgi:hypothetical protein